MVDSTKDEYQTNDTGNGTPPPKEDPPPKVPAGEPTDPPAEEV